MNRSRLVAAACLIGVGIAGAVLSAFSISETTDFPNSTNANTASMATLDSGSNTVAGQLNGSCVVDGFVDCNPRASFNAGDTQDSFNLTVPAGFEVTSYTVTSSNWTGPAGLRITTNVAKVTGTPPTASYVSPAAIPTHDLVANGTTTNHVTTPLGPGKYGVSVYGQTASTAGPYSLNYTVTIVLAVHDSTLCVNAGGTGGCYSNVQSAVNAAFNGDDIDIAAGTYSTSSCVADHVNNTQSPTLVTINKDLTIHGAGAGSTVLSGGCRVIHVTAGTATISGVTVTGGTESLGFGGGGVRNDSNLTMTDSVISGNSSTGSGGGFQATAGSSTFQRVVFESNTAGLGAGLRTGGASLSLTDVTIRNNQANAGGAHALLDTGGSLTLNRVTVNGNTGTDTNEAAIALGPGGSTTLTNVTITGNSRHGLLVNGGSRNVALNNVTIDGNTGTGIYQFNGSDVITVKNSIVSNNAAGDCLGSIVSGDYNLFESTAGCTITGSASHDVIGVDPALTPLASNGGPTQTKALCSGAGSPSASCAAASFAIDAGSPSTPGSGAGACEAVDQRGVTRPQGLVCDMGAFEAPGSAPGGADQTISVTTPAPTSAAFNSTFGVAATATSGLGVAITSTGGCSGSGTGGATITMTSSTTTCVVHYNQAGNVNYNAAQEVTNNTSATPADQTISVTTPAPVSAVYNSTFGVAATASSGLGVAITTTGGCSGSGTDSATITMTSGTAACGVRYNQPGFGDYSAAQEVTNNTSATPAGQTISVTTPAPASAVYNSTFGVAATASSGLGVAITTTGGCSGSGTGSATITMTSGTTACGVRYNQAGSANFSAALEVTSNTTASRASQTIAVTQSAPPSAPINSTFTVAATASSGLGVSITATGSCTGSGTGSTLITMTSANGNCNVSYTQAGNVNYLAAPPVSQKTMAQKAQKLSQTITVTQQAPATASTNSTFTVAATASSGLPVSISTQGSGAACTISGNTITTGKKKGACKVTFSQAGDASYGAAPDVVQTTTVQ